MKKNVFSFISLGLVAVAFILLIVSFIPMAEIKGSRMKLFGGIGTTLGWLGFLSAALALVTGIIGLVKKDPGPRKIAVILSVIFLIGTLIGASAVSILGEVTKYANEEKSIFDEMDGDAKKSVDDLVKSLREGKPN